MTRRNTGWTLAGIGTLTFAATLGCEAQVNDEYAGEPLLSLRGNVVVSTDQVDNDAVPHIAFVDFHAKSIVLLDGEVSGEFPAKFRFDVTQPPPEETLAEYPELGFNSGVAIGRLVLSPANGDERMASDLVTEIYQDGDCTEADSQCIRVERTCSESDPGRCRERTLECKQRACEPVEEWGDSALGSTTVSRATDFCDAESCYVLQSACDDENACHSDVRSCDFVQHDGWEAMGDDPTILCRVSSESGDTSLTDYADLLTATNYAIVYVTDDNPDTVYGSLKRGYNLVAGPASRDEWLASEKCQLATIAQVVAEYNMDNDTNYDLLGSDLDEISVDLAALAECWSAVVIEEPLDEALTIVMSNNESSVF